ncbi:MAG: 6-phosphogluconolactonase [Nitrospirota bacterium]|nr:MAG: 6-phosphogluconolactonase [Nitrospirota bacterium]
MNKKIEQVPDFEGLVRVAAQHIVNVSQETIANHGQMAFALAGGSTPKKLYSLLAGDPFRSQIPWGSIHFFWGDERHVPPDHQDSNYRMAREALLAHVPVPDDHVHRIPSEMQNAEEAADSYERELREYFQLAPGQNPRFDLILLGLGPDGHTASLFPGTPAVHDTTRLVAAPWVKKFSTFRITLTPAILNKADHVMFLVSGQDKAEALRSVLEGPYQPEVFPAQVIHPAQGQLIWLVDKEAAGCLRSPLTV